MAIELDGITLPDLPSGLTSPFVAIFYMSMPEYGINMYVAVATNEPLLYIPPELLSSGGVVAVIGKVTTATNTITGQNTMFSPTESVEWEEVADSNVADFPIGSQDGMTYAIVWANYDIVTAASVNDDGTYVMGSEVYFANCDEAYEEAYWMPSGWYRSMGGNARRLGGVSKKLNPDEMLSIYQKVNALEPKLAEMNAFVADNPDLPLTFYVDGTEHNFKVTIPEFMVDYIDTIVAPNLLYIPTQAFEGGNRYIGSSGFTNLKLKTAVFNSATDMGAGVFAYQYELSKIIAPKLTILRNSFTGCESLVEITKDFFPEATEITYTTFNGCFNLTRADFPKLSKMSNYVFSETNLTVLILRNDSKVCTFTGVDSKTFGETPLAAGKGVVLVPAALATTYPTYSTWDRLATAGSKFLPLEQYTVDGTLTGDIDWAKVDAELAKL